jgi:hypothetical protein
MRLPGGDEPELKAVLGVEELVAQATRVLWTHSDDAGMAGMHLDAFQRVFSECYHVAPVTRYPIVAIARKYDWGGCRYAKYITITCPSCRGKKRGTIFGLSHCDCNSK